MNIEAVDFFYLSMPEVTTEADGSQDALLVRVAAGGMTAGASARPRRCVSSPPSSCPMSHGACRPVGDSVLGQSIDGPADIARMAAGGRIRQHGPAAGRAHLVRRRDGAVGPARQGARRAGLAAARLRAGASAKTPYASQLFGDTPQETLDALGRSARDKGFRAVKFGWGPLGRGTAQADADQIMAAREGIGPDGILLVDVGQIFGEDVEAAAARLPALEAAGALWLEEPFQAGALEAYGALARRTPRSSWPAARAPTTSTWRGT